MPIKCYEKPNRRKKRKYQCSDVARITKYAEQNGCDKHELMVIVAESLGFVGIFCVAAKGLSALNPILELIAKIGTVLAITKLIDTLVKWLAESTFTKLPQTRIAAAAIILILVATNSLFDNVATLWNGYAEYKKALTEVNKMCQIAAQRIKDGVAKGQDLLN